MTGTTIERRILNWLVPPEGVTQCDCGSYLWIWLTDGSHVCHACRRRRSPAPASPTNPSQRRS